MTERPTSFTPEYVEQQLREALKSSFEAKRNHTKGHEHIGGMTKRGRNTLNLQFWIHLAKEYGLNVIDITAEVEKELNSQ